MATDSAVVLAQAASAAAATAAASVERYRHSPERRRSLMAWLRVKCRWCRFNRENTPKGFAELWRHTRKKHPSELETCDYPDVRQSA